MGLVRILRNLCFGEKDKIRFKGVMVLHMVENSSKNWKVVNLNEETAGRATKILIYVSIKRRGIRPEDNSGPLPKWELKFLCHRRNNFINFAYV